MFHHKLTNDAELVLVEPRHAEELYALIDRNRERLRPWMTFTEHVVSADGERDFARSALRQFADGLGFHCLIVHEGRVAGGIGLLPIDRANRATEVGYWLGEEAEGKGLVTAACKAVFDHCFGNLGINRIVIRTGIGNERSRAVAERLGAKWEGLQRQGILIDGAFQDLNVSSVLREEWRQADGGTGAFFTKRLDDRTELGLLEHNHAEELFALVDRNRQYLRCWLRWVDSTNSPDDVKNFRTQSLHGLADNGTTAAGIWRDDALAGVIGLHPGDDGMAIGYWLGEEHQGHGIVTSACRAMLDRAFNELDANRVQIRADPRNARSRAIPERLGFHLEGTLRHAGVGADGAPVDLTVYSMLKTEWEELRNET